MHVFLLREVEESSKDVLEDDVSLRLLEWSSGGDAILEIPLIAEFSDDVAIIDGAVDIEAVDEVGMPEFLEYLYFYVELFLHKLWLFVAQVDHLDGYLLLGLLVEALEGAALVGQVEVVVQAVGVVLDLLAQLVAVISHQTNNILGQG